MSDKAQDVGDRFRTMRTKLGLSQQHFAKMLGYSDKGGNCRVSEIERGLVIPSKSVLLLLEFMEKRKQ